MKKWLCLISLAFSLNGYCQIPDDLVTQEFLSDIQKFKNVDKRMQGVWWIPTEYWDVVKKIMPTLNQADVDRIKNTVKDYLIFAVFDGSLDPTAGSDYRTEGELNMALRLIDASGNVHTSLKELEVSPEAYHIAKIMKPMLGQMVGEMGEGMHIFYFKSAYAGNHISAVNNGKFTIQLDKETFEWNLPLPTLLPSKVCPTDKQKMKGSWRYCPYHGTKLN